MWYDVFVKSLSPPCSSICNARIAPKCLQEINITKKKQLKKQKQKQATTNKQEEVWTRELKNVNVTKKKNKQEFFIFFKIQNNIAITCTCINLICLDVPVYSMS